MANGLAAQTGIEDHEFGPEVDRSIDILRESVRLLIKERGGVVLSTDCFTKEIKIDASDEGMKDVDAVMKRLKFAFKEVFLDEKIPFKVVSRNGAISIKKSDSYVSNFERQVLPRKVEDKGRIAISELSFLKKGFPVNLYYKTVNGKVYVVISNRGDLGLDQQGFNQKMAAVDGHKRISLSGAMDSQISDHSCNIKIVVRGFYAVIIPDDEDSQFASLADYEGGVLPLLEDLQ